MNKIYLIILLNLSAIQLAQAGVFELSASGNYRRQQINDLNFQESQSLTGSVSYYFMEMSAIELSYTKGISKLRAQASANDVWVEYHNEFTLYGADLVLTMAQQTSMLQPFVKVGVAHIIKDLVIKSETGSASRTPSEPETVPSLGVGFKFRITKTFSIKAGADAWLTNQADDNEKIDYAGRIGVSWLL